MCFVELMGRALLSPSRYLPELLPWAALVAPGVVLNKDGSFQKTYAYRAPDVDSLTDAELVRRATRLNETLRRLGSGWVLFAESRRVQAVSYPRSEFRDEIAWLLDEERRAAFEEEGAHFENRTYLTLQYLPPRPQVRRLQRFALDRGAAAKKAATSDELADFASECRRIRDQLAEQFVEIRELSDDETLTYLHSTISVSSHRVIAPGIPIDLDAMLADSDFVGGMKPMLLRSGAIQHLRVVSIRSFPAQVVPAMLDRLNALPFEYRWVTRYIALDPAQAEKAMLRYRKSWFGGRKGVGTLLKEAVTGEVSILEDPEAVRKAGDVNEALIELKSGGSGYGYVTMNLVVFDSDEDRVEHKAATVEKVLNELGFVARVETYNAPEAWLSTVPGITTANVRRPLLSSLVLSRLLPVSGVWAGPSRCEYLDGPPLFYAKSNGTTPFRFVSHVGDVGHQLIVGPTGKGKSTLMALQALSFQRYPDARVVFFDKGQSSLAATSAVGGAYYELGDMRSCGFQPLAGVDDPDERVWALGWVEALLRDEGVRLSPPETLELSEALKQLGGFGRLQRSLTGLRSLVQARPVQDVLARFTEGSLGELFDGDAETLGDSHWITFEMEKLLANETACRPALRHVFHRLESMLDGRPTGIWIDEAWVFLSDPYFGSQLQEWLRTLRRKNAFVVMATQSMAEIAASDIAAVLSESCPIRVWLPNERANEPVSRGLYEQFGLNERQIDIIGGLESKREYYLQSPLGNRRFELGLGPIALAYCGASSKRDLVGIRELLVDVSRGASLPSARDFNRVWLQECGLAWAVQHLETFRDVRKQQKENPCDLRSL